MTVAVEVVYETIVFAPPIVRRFLGQPSRNLGAWMRRQPGFRVERMS